MTIGADSCSSLAMVPDGITRVTIGSEAALTTLSTFQGIDCQLLR